MKYWLIILSLASLASCKTMDAVSSKLHSMETLPARDFVDPFDEGSMKKMELGAPKNVLKIQSQHSRITINGKPYVDTSGEIEEIVSHSDTGYITYVTSTLADGRKWRIIKMDSPFKNSKKKEIARFSATNGRYYFDIPNHESRVAIDYRLTSKGVVLFHTGGYFSYVSDTVVTELHAIPVGYSLLPIQAGDIAQAGFVGFTKYKDLYRTGVFAQPDNLVYEVIFMDIHTGAIRSADLIKVQRSDAGLSEADSFNQRIQLATSNDGFIVMTLQPSYENLYAKNLHTGAKKSIVYRHNGVAHFKSGVDDAGNVWVRATYGANDERFIPDVASELSLQNRE